MSEQRMRLASLDDAGLEAVLRASADSVAWPSASPSGAPDIAVRVRARLVAVPPQAAGRRGLAGWRPVRRSLVLALIALLALAAIAGAVGLGLPGLRLILGQPPASAPPSVVPSQSRPPGSLGSTLRLGMEVAIEDVEGLTGAPVRLPTDPAIGPPDAVYVDTTREQVAYVWAASDELPQTREPGIGLIVTQFEGRLDDGYRQKLIGEGVKVEPVTVAGRRGFWVSGQAHFFFYIGPDGGIIDDERRWVGDALAWTDGATTYRMESALGRDAAIAAAESME